MIDLVVVGGTSASSVVVVIVSIPDSKLVGYCSTAMVNISPPPTILLHTSNSWPVKL